MVCEAPPARSLSPSVPGFTLPFSPELRTFLRQHISSPEQIDVLLLLRATRPRAWSANEVADELGIARESAMMRLFLLSSKGLLHSQGSREPHYQYPPESEEQESLRANMAELARANEEHRASLLALLGVAPDPVRSFADAFRLKR